MLPGRWGSLPLREKNLNQIDYAEESWSVFPTKQENVFGKQGETVSVHFPAPSGVVLAQDSRGEQPPPPAAVGLIAVLCPCEDREPLQGPEEAKYGGHGQWKPGQPRWHLQGRREGARKAEWEAGSASSPGLRG